MGKSSSNYGGSTEPVAEQSTLHSKESKDEKAKVDETDPTSIQRQEVELALQMLRKRFTYIRLLVAANPTKLDITLLCVGIIAAIAAGVPFPLLGIIFGQLVDNLNNATCSVDQDPANALSYHSAVNTKVIQVVYIGVIQFFTIYIYTVSWRLVGERLGQRLRDEYFRSLLRQEPSYFDDLPAGEVSSRLNGDIGIIQAGTSEKVGICIASASFFITAYIVAFIKDARLAGMLISLVPAFLIMSLVGERYISKYSGRMSDHIASASSIASEGLSNMTVVQVFSASKRLETKFARDLMKAQKAGIKKATATAVQAGLLYFIAFSGNALAFWQGSRTIATSVEQTGTATTVGTTYTVIFILVDASLMLSQVAPFLQNFGSAAASFQKLEKDMDHLSAIDGTSETGGKVLTVTSGSIEFANVSFSYPSRPDRLVVQNFSLTCPAGKHTAIVGMSGSGKSTIASLIARLYDPFEGRVLLDGDDVKKLNLRRLRSFIGFVPQEPSLLDRSILENIALGLVNSSAARFSHLEETLLGPGLSEVASAVRGGQDMDEAARVQGPNIVEIVHLVRQAAALSDAIDFIGRLEYGLATTVGSTGNLISGGQKQRIGLARALIKDPEILILDEATASLDSSSEQRIQAAVEEIAASRTMITIAHRLSTIRNADNIVVMAQGQILEQGTHPDLIAGNGTYASMIRLQGLKSQDSQDKEFVGGWMSNESVDDISVTKASADQVLSSKEDLNEKTASEKEQAAQTTVEPGLEEEEEGLPSDRSTWSIARGLAPMIRPFLFCLVAAFFTSTIVGSCYSVEAVIFGNTVAALSPCKSEESIRSKGELFGLLFFVLAIVEFSANAISWSAFGYTAEKLLYKVRILSFRSLFEQDLQWHQSENRSPSMLLSFITRDGNALGGLTGSIIGTIFSIVVNLLVAVILSTVVAWKIALVCLTTVPILLGASIMQLRVLSRFEERHEEAFSHSTGITVEAINSIKTIASLSLEHEVLGVYRRALKAPRKEITRASAHANFWLAIAYSIGNLVYALAYWWGSKLIIAGDYSQVQFFIVLLALLVSAQLWGQMFMLAPDLTKAQRSIARILNLIDLGSTRISSNMESSPPSSHFEKDVESFSGTALEAPPPIIAGGMSIVLDSVSFSYPARPNVQVLNSLSLTLEPGQFGALVGPSGAGKSTIISIIERLFHPTSGSILLDNLDISLSGSTSFRDSIALVPQDSVLFEGSIAFNVSIGSRPGVAPSQEDIESACRLANIHDTIVSLPKGYETNCGPNGNQLSGGQKQRLSIARALVRKPRLLLLDESTSALDAESERLLQEGLETAVSGSGMSVLCIAHRLRTIREADVIFLVEGGEVVDQGRHEELMGRSERYRVNAELQTFATPQN